MRRQPWQQRVDRKKEQHVKNYDDEEIGQRSPLRAHKV